MASRAATKGVSKAKDSKVRVNKVNRAKVEVRAAAKAKVVKAKQGSKDNPVIRLYAAVQPVLLQPFSIN